MIRRRLRSDAPPSYETLAAELGVPERAVELEAMPLRMRRENPPRGTINATPECASFAKMLAEANGVPVWAVTDIVYSQWAEYKAKEAAGLRMR
ncbi:hypothetical protein [Falsiroseomonas sp.]|uniref:hypothetical protein n=1 Tax=Falsiroseomonas sp. TaxID=2870721 RepID=UPI003567098C